MIKKLHLLLLISIISLTAFSQNFHKQWNPQTSSFAIDPPDLYNDYFAGAGSCMMCHNSQTNQQGESIAIVNDWRSTMMANAARDPFWQAKVSHETLVNPQLKNDIETICIRCHAPMGSLEAFYNGEDHYSMEQMKSDPLAMDGVSCTVCHQITPESMGNSSGNFITNQEQKIYGPYINPFANPMINNTGFEPVYSEHIKDSRLCASCHTLITNPVDLNGVPTGGEFVEQSPYQEWENSVYHEEGTSCYSCHVPEIDDIVKISSMPPWLDGRTPFGKHHFAGANVFMLKVLKNNIDELGITADAVHFDSSISRTYENLQLNTMGLSMVEQDRDLDTLFVDVELANLAGHKLPTAYPSRRVFVELFAINSNGDTIFHSGKTDSEFNLISEDMSFESHNNIINSSEQVQIYELVMGDVNGDYTTVLERSAIQLKDNRIPPIGFTTTHFSYDTTEIVGSALTDPDFNKINTYEGSGMDKVHFKIPTNENTNNITVSTKVFYQTVTNKWLEHMFSYSSEDIDRFRTMYNEADKSPVLLGETSLTSTYTSIPSNKYDDLTVFPNPSKGSISINKLSHAETIVIYDLNGRFVKDIRITAGENNLKNIFVTDKKGIYFIVVNYGNTKVIRKIIIN